MKRYSLEQLTENIQADPQLVERLFDYHARTGNYGHTAIAAATAAARTPLQEMDLARARTNFGRDMSNPDEKETLMRAYLPSYSQGRNQRNWKKSIKSAAVLGGAGVVGIILAQFIDPKAAKALLEAAGVASVAGSPVALGIAYFKYRV